MDIDVGFTHIALTVTDLTASARFYAHYGGLHPVHSRGDGAGETRVKWLADGHRPFALVLLEAPRAEPILAPFAHLGVAVETRARLDQLCEEARGEGVLIREPEDSGPPVGYWAFLRDPDGHTLELSHGQQVEVSARGR